MAKKTGGPVKRFPSVERYLKKKQAARKLITLAWERDTDAKEVGIEERDEMAREVYADLAANRTKHMKSGREVGYSKIGFGDTVILGEIDENGEIAIHDLAKRRTSYGPPVAEELRREEPVELTRGEVRDLLAAARWWLGGTDLQKDPAGVGTLIKKVERKL